MLEERSCLISSGYRRSCERENNWSCMSYRLEKIDVQNGKRPLQSDRDGESGGMRKLFKQSDTHERVEMPLRMPDISLSLALVDQHQDSPDNDSEIDFWDSSIGCVVRCSKQRCVRNDGGVRCSKQRCVRNDGGVRDSLEQSDAFEGVELTLRLPDVSLFPVDQSDNNHQPSSYSDPLIPSINRDNSISCLMRCSRSDYGSLSLVNQSFRSLIRSGELYRLRRHNGVIEHWVYFSCRLLEWEAFDPNRRRWMRLPTMPSKEYFMSSDKESLAVGTQLLVFSKEFMFHVIHKYCLLTNTWSSGMTMNAPRCLFGSASLREIAILAGGCDSEGVILSSAELYNSGNGTWVTLPNMHKSRKMCSAVFMDEKFYVIGGIGGSDLKPLTCGEEFNLKTKVWTEIPNMSPVRSGAARGNEMPATGEAPPLVAVVNDELYAADYADMEVRKYDKGRRVWFTVGRLPERAGSMNGWGLAFRACGDQLIVIGGPRAMGEAYIEVNSWVPSEGPAEWNLLGRKQTGNFVYNCAVMGC